MEVSAVHQCESVVLSISLCSPSLRTFPPPPNPHPTALGHRRAPRWAPVLDSRFPLATCLAHGSGYTSTLFSQFVPPSSSLAVSTGHLGHWCPSTPLPSWCFLGSPPKQTTYTKSSPEDSFWETQPRTRFKEAHVIENRLVVAKWKAVVLEVWD